MEVGRFLFEETEDAVTARSKDSGGSVSVTSTESTDGGGSYEDTNGNGQYDEGEPIVVTATRKPGQVYIFDSGGDTGTYDGGTFGSGDGGGGDPYAAPAADEDQIDVKINVDNLLRSRRRRLPNSSRRLNGLVKQSRNSRMMNTSHSRMDIQ